MIKRILIITTCLLITTASILSWFAWKYIYKNNVKIEQQEVSFYIHTNDSFAMVINNLKTQKIVTDIESFTWIAQKMNLPNHIYPGRYIINDGLNNRELITLLRSGKQTPIKITFHNIRTKNELARDLASQIELDSIEIIQLLHNREYANKFGFNSENFVCMFIPNTYEVYWNISADALFNRFEREYKRFWNTQKKQKAKTLGLTPIKVSILASIVEKESSLVKEYPIIAGVYLNRLHRKIPLQADPTIVFATGNFSIKRVLHKHLEINSLYNTYKHQGLPPGPICLPSIQAINSVLNKKSHNYLYFCAKDDFSGEHIFAKTLRQHNQNARLYRKALNKKRIYN